MNAATPAVTDATIRILGSVTYLALTIWLFRLARREIRRPIRNPWRIAWRSALGLLLCMFAATEGVWALGFLDRKQRGRLTRLAGWPSEALLAVVFITLLASFIWSRRHSRTEVATTGAPGSPTPQGQPGEDPGWAPLLEPFTSMIGPRSATRDRGGRATALVTLRFLFLAFLVALFLFLFDLTFIAPWQGERSVGLVPGILVVWGLASLFGARWSRERQLDATSPGSLLGSYRTSMFLGIAFSESAALVAFVSVFLTGSMWVYLIGLAFALVGLWMVGPTRGNIERRDEQLRAGGSPLSLREALLATPTAPAGHVG